MAITFIRIDDRMIHGQTCLNWAAQYPCDGIVLVNDHAANTPVLKAAFKSASNRKTFVWTYEEWKQKCQKVLDSKDNYFLITKEPVLMAKILVEDDFVPGNIKEVIIGPCNERVGSIKLGFNQSIMPEEAEALEKIMQAGHQVEFALIKEDSIGNWKKFRKRFGYSD
jgi:PTS system mannose-specific IIB component